MSASDPRGATLPTSDSDFILPSGDTPKVVKMEDGVTVGRVGSLTVVDVNIGTVSGISIHSGISPPVHVPLGWHVRVTFILSSYPSSQTNIATPPSLYRETMTVPFAGDDRAGHDTG